MNAWMIAAALAGAAMGTGASDRLAPPPPYQAAYTPTTVDERGLWQQADEAERDLRDSPVVIRDAALNAYMSRVLCRSVGEDRCRGVRIYVVRAPYFNAFMAPNGMMVVWTGTLLRLRDEAELAAVLGHEFGHFEMRHSLASFRQRRTIGDIIAWAGVAAPYSLLPVSLIRLHFAYSRGQETEADLMGLRYLKAAGYRPRAASRIWERIMAEEDATALGRKRHVTHRYSAGFFADHPTELTRATYLRDAAGQDGESGDDARESFQTAMQPLRATFLADQIKLNDFGGSEYLLGELASGQWTPELLVTRGELYRERGNPRDLVSAAQFYQQAIDAGCTDPIAWRGLGLSLLRGQQVEAGRAALKTYLERAPQASDRAAMAMLIGEGGVQ
ncbi:M48 family metallopeptidase [Sphingomonas sp. GM_Shp_1]|uniref:M48 family metallopeptidase n=1 Tax=Sphingomonas sp. GM_Shp_1 TaxID=2937381 RepID=UPI00226B190D|nr:M48 family metallopeptidase [Sphingomonas sp. GM_Shp_1]